MMKLGGFQSAGALTTVWFLGIKAVKLDFYKQPMNMILRLKQQTNK